MSTQRSRTGVVRQQNKKLQNKKAPWIPGGFRHEESKMKLHEQIEKVKETILERGFTQGVLVNLRGEVCMRGAIGVTERGLAGNFDARGHLDRFLGRLAAERMGGTEVVIQFDGYKKRMDALPAFNDTHSEAEVLAF